MLVVSVLTTLSAFCAEGTETRRANRTELQVQGSVTTVNTSHEDSDTGTTTTTLTGQLVLNQFIGSFFSIGLALQPVVSSSTLDSGHGDDSESSSSEIYALLRLDGYLVPDSSPVVPYIGVHGGLASYSSKSERNGSDSDDSGSSASYGGHVGLKIFATERASWGIEASGTTYERNIEDSRSDDDKIAVVVGSLFVGMSYFF